MIAPLAALAFLGVLGASFVALGVFESLPYIDDGVASLFQARIFARGQVTLPLPVDPEFVEQFGVLGAAAGLGHWCSMYPPGWPAILTLGVAAGSPWLVNPLLTGALVAATGVLGTTLHDRRTGLLAAALTATCPLFLLLGGTHLAHVSTALGTVLGLLGVLGVVRTGRLAYGALAGAGVGFAVLARPLDGALLGIVFAIPVIVALVRESGAVRRLAPSILVALGVTAGAIGVLLAYQQATTGNALTPGHTIGLGRAGTFGFVQIGETSHHTIARAVEHTLLRLRALNADLVPGPFPGLGLILLPFVLRRARPLDTLLLAGPFLLVFVYAFFWYYDAYAPARYASAALPFWIVLVARGVVLVHERLAAMSTTHGRAVVAAGFASLLYFYALELPAKAAEVLELQGDVEHTLARVVETYEIHDAVVFTDAINRASFYYTPFNDFFATAFVRNDLDLQGDVVFLRNLRERNVRWFERYPGRAFYFYRLDRATRRASLYRMHPCGTTFVLDPVVPREPDLLDFDAVRAAQPGRCEEVEAD